jgi:hypothetical protein
MLENHHEVLIHKNGSFVGTGHNSEIITDKAGSDWVFYHAVNVNDPSGRVLMLDRIDWKDGWPAVATDSPSLKSGWIDEAQGNLLNCSSSQFGHTKGIPFTSITKSAYSSDK